jgi:polysaccharide export outer membrane protein
LRPLSLLALLAALLFLLAGSARAEILYSARSGRRSVPSVTGGGPTATNPSGPQAPGDREPESPISASQEPLLESPVDPSEYILGPADVLGLTLQGAMSSFHELIVSPEGTVLVPGAGEVAAAGLTLDAGRAAIEQEVARAFRNVKVTVTLLRLRQFTVFVLGQVQEPGQIAASPVVRVSEAIRAAGGLTPEASRRSIHIRHRDGTVSACDLRRFTQTGDRDANPQLRGGDIIQVDFRREGILLNGEVHEPGEFELLEGDSLGEMISLAGGLTERAALDTVEIGRYAPGATVPTLIHVSAGAGGDISPILSFRLQPRDAVLIRAIPNWDIRRTVAVQGEVTYPGTYVIDEDKTTLTEVIRRAGGFTEKASLREATLTRRVDETIKDAEFERLRTVPAADMSPSEYSYFKMRSRQRGGLMAVDFVSLFQRADASQDVLLKSGDVILVPPAKAYVTLAGQVALPGNITYEPGLTVEDYIDRAGGYAWKSAPSRTTVIRASTGEWIPKTKAGKIGPGDTIWVPEKPDRDWFSVFKEGLTVTTQLATIWLVIRSSTK